MNEFEQLGQLLDEILNNLQSAISAGEVLSPEIQDMIAQEINFLTSRIEQLQAAETPVTPSIPKAPFDSAVVNGFRYNPKTGDLFVKFQGDYPLENGNEYVYKNVEPFVFDIFRRGAVAPKSTGSNSWHAWKQGVSPSLGASLNALLKQGGYSFSKLT